jgi:hypothetical protein
MSAIKEIKDGIGRSRGQNACRVFSPAKTLSALAAVGLVCTISGQPMAAPPGAPVADRVFAGCTFTTADLQLLLNIPNSSLNKFVGDAIQGSYILIYVRANPNDGQPLDAGGFTGPVLCINSDTETIDQTTETTPIPNSTNHPGVTSVDIRGAETAFHLQYELNPTPGDIEKRVCHSVAGNTDCYFIQPGP